MQTFPENIQFCYPWRSYQDRVLKDLEGHLKNRHLHLIAPPGTGKTVLGLEIMLLYHPRFMTVTTYQSLHSFMKEEIDITDETGRQTDLKGNNESPPLCKTNKGKALVKIKGIGFRTIILDEAHHLRILNIILGEIEKQYCS